MSCKLYNSIDSRWKNICWLKCLVCLIWWWFIIRVIRVRIEFRKFVWVSILLVCMLMKRLINFVKVLVVI